MQKWRDEKEKDVLNLYRFQYHLADAEEENAHLGAVNQKKTSDVVSVIIV